MLGGLHRGRVAAAPAVMLEVEATTLVQRHDPRRFGGAEPAVVDPLGQADEVAGESVAPNVRALPDAVAHHADERLGQRPAPGRAALVVTAVGAGKIERPGDRGAIAWRLSRPQPRPVQAEQLTRILLTEFLEPARLPAGMGEERMAGAGQRPSRTADEQHADTDRLRPLVQRPAQGGVEAALDERLPAPRAGLLDKHPGTHARGGGEQRLTQRAGNRAAGPLRQRRRAPGGPPGSASGPGRAGSGGRVHRQDRRRRTAHAAAASAAPARPKRET